MTISEVAQQAGLYIAVSRHFSGTFAGCPGRPEGPQPAIAMGQLPANGFVPAYGKLPTPVRSIPMQNSPSRTDDAGIVNPLAKSNPEAA